MTIKTVLAHDLPPGTYSIYYDPKRKRAPFFWREVKSAAEVIDSIRELECFTNIKGMILHIGCRTRDGGRIGPNS